MTRLDRFSLTLGGRQILREVTLHPKRGELLALCGPNGAGKTSILKALAGLVPGGARPDPRHVAYLAQNTPPSWALTVGQIATLGRIPHGDRLAAPVGNALRRCGIESLRDARIDRISGGEARRAMLARVFATEPGMFLLDEPTADLDPAACHAILRLLRETAEAGAAVVVVLHAVELATEYAHRIVLVDQGRIAADCPAAQALAAAAAIFGMRAGVGPRLLPNP
ncbi:MAG: ABC transporter ATP-binding protein [Acetobacteraceae bacterium]|nr:ABC transporter ATP-binding protein [Acetobacteraceae bacterium]